MAKGQRIFGLIKFAGSLLKRLPDSGYIPNNQQFGLLGVHAIPAGRLYTP
jgi:hypothetical protein